VEDSYTLASFGPDRRAVGSPAVEEVDNSPTRDLVALDCLGHTVDAAYIIHTFYFVTDHCNTTLLTTTIHNHKLCLHAV